MKKLTIQDKAELYDKALKQIKECTPDENGFVTIYPNEIFPELKESEEERIKNEIIDYISTADDKELIPYESWIAWIEKQGEQKTTWSEDDEKTLQSIILDFKDFKHDHASCLAPHFDICIAWLKSLKDRYTWKPTEEQINAIRLARNSFVRNDYSGCSFLNKTLLELENQLKKIRNNYEL